MAQHDYIERYADNRPIEPFFADHDEEKLGMGVGFATREPERPVPHPAVVGVSGVFLKLGAGFLRGRVEGEEEEEMEMVVETLSLSSSFS